MTMKNGRLLETAQEYPIGLYMKTRGLRADRVRGIRVEEFETGFLVCLFSNGGRFVTSMVQGRAVPECDASRNPQRLRSYISFDSTESPNINVMNLRSEDGLPGQPRSGTVK